VYLDSADSERLLSMVLVLATEVSALDAELSTLREALQARGALDAAALAAARSASGAASRRRDRRRALVERMLRIVLEDLAPRT
jgi:hypothetical protein